MKKRIAIIGTGISGLTAAYYLEKNFDLMLFEAGDYIGGHTATKDVEYQGESHAIDTGFIVFNDWTYPNFIALMNEIGVTSKPTSMGFSLSCRETGLEYSGNGLNTLFAQRRNIFRPRHWKMLRDIVRFNKQSQQDFLSDDLDENETLGSYLDRHNFGEAFKKYYLVPMAAAIWSSGLAKVEAMPVLFFVRFFKNHGLLNIKDRPQWRVIEGGSRSYIEPLVAGFRDQIHLNTPVTSVKRHAKGVTLGLAHGRCIDFDEVIFACHSDQALALLTDPSEKESEILSGIPYAENDVVLHTDATLLPKRKSTWSSWNYLLGIKKEAAVLTYNMNILQGLKSEHTFCVTLNATEDIAPEKIIGRWTYAHPEFNTQGIAMQARWSEINGTANTWFCGAWWRNGFHEDGVVSGMRVASALLDEPLEIAAE